ncbi:hypothetical protein [Actinoplanes derwentensis]|uniref:Uncharacterized protein n=1 Tax=Actinoplanes derwentensis TaxID=113562 RepID=A0A1H2DAY7_9ACTN|nr:hypothetical protein [Actinoplanes derwentensis]GID88498.1 hypothetical protein Ade03nite_74220 [Actinoplanes derwentensis]SDT79910.1 hypothetical protein SAMN04489716_8984 [Actinoplanes derwentensis]
MTFASAAQPGPRPGPPSGGFRPGPPPVGPRPAVTDTGAVPRPAVVDPGVVPGDGEGSGHPAVDAVLRSLANAARLAPAEQIAEYEAAHQVLQETLAGIDR